MPKGHDTEGPAPEQFTAGRTATHGRDPHQLKFVEGLHIVADDDCEEYSPQKERPAETSCNELELTATPIPTGMNCEKSSLA